MIQRLTEIKLAWVACLFAGVVVSSGPTAIADDPKSDGVPPISNARRLTAFQFQQISEKAKEQRAGVKTLEKLLEAQRKELWETEASLEAARKSLAEVRDAERAAFVARSGQRAQALKVLLAREKGTEDYLGRLESRTPVGPATSLDSRFHASELELTRKDLKQIRAEIGAIREGQATTPRP